MKSGQLPNLQFTKNGKHFGVFGLLDPPKCDFRKMDFNLHWLEVFSMLKPNFIGICWEINSGQLADIQFSKNVENFGVYGPLDPPKCDFRKMNFNLHWPEVFSMLKPNFMKIHLEMKSGQFPNFLFTCMVDRIIGRIQTKIHSSTA